MFFLSFFFLCSFFRHFVLVLCRKKNIAHSLNGLDSSLLHEEFSFKYLSVQKLRLFLFHQSGVGAPLLLLLLYYFIFSLLCAPRYDSVILYNNISHYVFRVETDFRKKNKNLLFRLLFLFSFYFRARKTEKKQSRDSKLTKWTEKTQKEKFK